jgi:hypothetical protein
MKDEPIEPLIETTYPGQAKSTHVAPREILEHYRDKGWDLPFVQPVGKLREAVESVRAARKKHQEMLDRDSPKHLEAEL